MTGADSRNENRAASCRDSPRNIPATMTVPSRLMPGSRARICEAPRHQSAQPTGAADDTLVGLHREARVLLLHLARCPDDMPSAAGRSSRRHPSLLPFGGRLQVGRDLLGFPVRAAPPRPLAGEQDEPFRNRKHAVRRGLLKMVRNVCSSAIPARPTGMWPG